jgi:tetratricopeptide (TPR) repeat protein
MAASPDRIFASIALALASLASALAAWSSFTLQRGLRSSMGGLEADVRAQTERGRSDFATLSSRLDTGFARLELRSNESSRAVASSFSALDRGLKRSLPGLDSRIEELSLIVKAERSERAAAIARSSEEPPSLPGDRSGRPPAAAGREEAARAESDLAVAAELDAARIHFSSGDYASSRDHFTAALRMQPDNIEARLYSALSLYRRNPADTSAYPLVEKDLRIVLASEPEDDEALDALGLISMERGDWIAAKKYFARRIDARPPFPRDVDARKKAALCALRSGHPAEAVELLDEALGLAPDDAEAGALSRDARSAPPE